MSLRQGLLSQEQFCNYCHRRRKFVIFSLVLTEVLYSVPPTSVEVKVWEAQTQPK